MLIRSNIMCPAAYLRMKLALSCLYCAPLVDATVYRGVKLDLRAQYPRGHKFINWAFASTTSSLDVLQAEQVHAHAHTDHCIPVC